MSANRSASPDGSRSQDVRSSSSVTSQDNRQPPFPPAVVDPDSRSPQPEHPTAERLLNAAAKHIFPEAEQTVIPPAGETRKNDGVTKEGRPDKHEEHEEREEEPIIGGTPLDEMSPLTPGPGKGVGGAFPFARQPSYKAAQAQKGNNQPRQVYGSTIPEDEAVIRDVPPPKDGEEEFSVKAVRPGFGAGREMGSIRMGASALMSALNALPWEEDDGASTDSDSSDDEDQTRARHRIGGAPPSRPKMNRLGSSLNTIRPSTDDVERQVAFRRARPEEQDGEGGSQIVAEIIPSDTRRSSGGDSLSSGTKEMMDAQIRKEEERATAEEDVEIERVMGASPKSPKGVPSEFNAAAALKEERSQSGQEVEDRMGMVPGEKQRVRRERLGQKLMDVFGLAERENVLEEMKCWLLRSVMLKGYMYLTAKHICFFAHMPDRENVVVKSGPLSKKASRTKLSTKYWVVLKNDVLSWFESTSDPYFPKGNLSLQYVSTVDAIDDTRFKIRTPERNYSFTAETESARDEWIKAIKKVMFKSQHEGENVKLVIPLSTILDVEKAPTLEFAETIEIRCIDPDDQMSVDSYFFASFANTERAMRSIQRIIDARPPDTLPRRNSNDYSEFLEGEEIRRKKNSDKSVLGVASAGLRKVFKPLSISGKHSGDDSSTLAEDDKKGGSILGLKLPRKSHDSEETLHPETTEDEYDGGYPPRQTGVAPKQGEKGWSSWIKKPVSKVLHPGSSSSSTSLHRVSSGTSSIALPPAGSVDRQKQPLTSLSPQQSRRAQLGASGAERVTEVVEPVMGGSGSESDGDEGHRRRSTTRRRKARLSFASERSAMSGLGRSEYAVVDDTEEGRMEVDETARKFRSVFSLSEKEELIDHFPGYLYRVLPVSGRFFVSTNYFCFRSSQLLYKTKMIIPIRDLYGMKAQKAFRFNHSGLNIVIKGHEEIFLEFATDERRKACVAILEERMEILRLQSPSANQDASADLDSNKIEMRIMEDLDESIPLETRVNAPPISPSPMFGSTTSTFLEFKPEPMKITCLTIGSRGDVQPYIALCKGLQAEGHSTRIASHGEYREWVEGHGIEFASVGGDPAELMQMCVDNGMFTISFMKEGLGKFRGWLDDLLQSSWEACQGSDLLIESPSAMAGVHVAEALQIPYYRAFTMPWTRTRAYPHAFAVPEHKKGGAYNYMTYTMFDQVFWTAISGQVNRWRRKTMHIEPTSFDKLEQHKIPFLYNFSPSIVPPPLDWTEWIHVTGYWFLENADESAAKEKKWEPPEGLLDFMETAKSKGKKIVYIGFGSIVVSDPQEMTKCVCDAVVDADVYAILSKGWSDRGAKGKDGEEEDKDGADGVKYPPEIFSIDSIDHSWLFPRIDAACHHGGAGTTGASLRAGIPTIIKPFFGDQAFWSERVESLNVGSAVRKLTVEALSEALKKATTDEKQIAKAKVVGETIRRENGVVRAIEAIYRDLEYAKSQIKPPPNPETSNALGKISSTLSTHSKGSSTAFSGLSLHRIRSPRKDHRPSSISSAIREEDQVADETNESGAVSKAEAVQKDYEAHHPEIRHDASVTNSSRDVSTERGEPGSDGSWSVVSGEGRSRATSVSGQEQMTVPPLGQGPTISLGAAI